MHEVSIRCGVHTGEAWRETDRVDAMGGCLFDEQKLALGLVNTVDGKKPAPIGVPEKFLKLR